MGLKNVLLFKYKDDVISWFISCVKLNQVGMVKIVHDLDLILHHLLPKTKAQRDVDGERKTQMQEKDRYTYTQNERCQLHSAVGDYASTGLGQLFLTLVRTIPFALVPGVA